MYCSKRQPFCLFFPNCNDFTSLLTDSAFFSSPLQAAFASPAPTPSTSPVNVPQGSLSPSHGLNAMQQEMVAKFIKDSNMNAEWSIK